MGLNELDAGIRPGGLRGLSSIDINLTPDTAIHQYDVSELSGFSDGDEVTTIPDQIGSADLSIQEGTAIYRESIVNGDDAIEFQGDTFFDATGVTQMTTPNTIYLSFRYRNRDDQLPVSFGTPDANDDSTHNISIISDNNEIFAGSALTGSNNDVTLITALFDGGDSILRENGTQVATGDTGTRTDTDFLRVGDRASNDDGIVFPAKGWFDELVIIDQQDIDNEFESSRIQTPTFEFDEQLTNLGGHQGMGADGTFIYTSSSRATDNAGSGGNGLRKWDKSGNLQDELLNPEDEGTSMDQVTDIFYYPSDGLLYCGSNNLLSGGDRGYVKVFDPSDMTYVEEYRVGDNICEGVARYDGSWWVIYGDTDYIDEYDDNFNLITSHTFDLSVDSDVVPGANDYQGIQWVGDYLYTPIHAGDGRWPQAVDIHYWDGSALQGVRRATNPTRMCTQGLHKEPGSDIMWFAERNTDTDTHDVVRATFNHTNGNPN